MAPKRWLVAFALWLFGPAAYGADALVTGHHLRPASAVTMPGRTVKLKLIHCFVKDESGAKPKPKSADDELAPLVPTPPSGGIKDKPPGKDRKPPPRLVCEGDEGYGADLAPLVVPANVKWEVVGGKGRVSGNGLNATYHAPESKPAQNEATVAASFTHNVGSQKVIALSRIKIVDQVEEYRGKATFTSPVAGISGTAEVIWTRVRKPDDDDENLRYLATGTIQGTVAVPDCKTEQVKLPINRSDGGELTVEPAPKTYSFEFTSGSPITLMCGKPRRPWLVAGGSFFHFGTVCGHPEGVPIADLLALNGNDNCTTTGLFGTTTWSFEAVK
jgi:hypothetical protein